MRSPAFSVFVTGVFSAMSRIRARILGGHRIAGAGIYIVYPSGKNVPRKVTAFRDLVLEWLHAHPLT